MPFAALLAALAEVPDPRRAQGQRYSMRHLLLFSVLATLAGATSYQKIVAFMALQRERLNTVFGACFRRAPAVNTLRHLFLQGHLVLITQCRGPASAPRPGVMAGIHSVAHNILRAKGVQNVQNISLALCANAVSFDQLLALGAQ